MAERFVSGLRGGERIGFRVPGTGIKVFISIEQNYSVDSAFGSNKAEKYYVKLSEYDGTVNRCVFTEEQMEEFIMAYQILKEGYKNGKNL